MTHHTDVKAVKHPSAPRDTPGTLLRMGFPADTRRTPEDSQNQFRRNKRSAPDIVTDESGAVTAEYALIITAAVAFAGLLIIILRSDEVRGALLSIVQNALSSAG